MRIQDAMQLDGEDDLRAEVRKSAPWLIVSSILRLLRLSGTRFIGIFGLQACFLESVLQLTTVLQRGLCTSSAPRHYSYL